MRLDHITSSFFERYVRNDTTLSTLETNLATTRSTRVRRKTSLRPQLITQHRMRVWREPINKPIDYATLHPLPGDHSVVEPPDPIPNSEVKRNRADGSVAQAMQE